MSCLQTCIIKSREMLTVLSNYIYNDLYRRFIKIACQSYNRKASACVICHRLRLLYRGGYTVTFISDCPHMMWHKWRQSGHSTASLETLWWASDTEMRILRPSDPLFRLSWNLASLSAGTHETLAGSAEVTDKDSAFSFNPLVCLLDLL